MDCNKADEAMLQYMEKTISPANAKALAIHLLSCESCREYFTALDMTIEALDVGEVEITEAPPGFTSGVMAKVVELPAYKKRKRAVYNTNLIMRIVGGVCSIIMGIAVMITSGGVSVPALDGIFPAIKEWADGLANGNSFLSLILSNGPSLSIAALVFAAVILMILVVLQRSEREENVKA